MSYYPEVIIKLYKGREIWLKLPLKENEHVIYGLLLLDKFSVSCIVYQLFHTNNI